MQLDLLRPCCSLLVHEVRLLDRERGRAPYLTFFVVMFFLRSWSRRPAPMSRQSPRAADSRENEEGKPS